MASPGMAWDVCALLNLLATGCSPQILQCLASEHLVERGVIGGEVLCLRAAPEEQADDQLIATDCGELTSAGILTTVDLAGNERVLFARLAAAMDDGEARTGALAIGRGLALVTDDRQAIRWFTSNRPDMVTLTTPEWVQAWAAAAQPPAASLRAAVRGITLRARYHPRPSDPAYAWWMAALDG